MKAMKTLKILGLMLSYPTAEHIGALPDCRRTLGEESWLPQQRLAELDSLVCWMQQRDLMDMQEEYVALFDRTPSLCLHLFEHVHGDSRERGQALVDLAQVYQSAGLACVEDEMPDYLPLFLEYLSLIDIEQARHDLSGLVDILATLAERLKNRQSPYAAIFGALIDAAAIAPNHGAVHKAITEDPGAPLTGQQIDKIWEEQHAFENTLPETSSSSCPKAEDMLARMNIQPEPRKG